MTTPKRKLEGKVAFITGGNTGLGLTSAKRFAQEGAKIAIFARDAANNAKAVRELQALDAEAIAIDGSVASIADIERAMAQTVERFGRIDVLFVNHGVTDNVAFLNVTEEQYDRVMDINAKGAFFTVQKAVPHMPAGASVILCTSVAVHLALPEQMQYTASKAALDSFRRTMSASLLSRGIRVNAVCPGMIRTEMRTRMMKEAGATLEQIENVHESYIPLGRSAAPDEIANAALFLASDDSAYMIGAEIIIDGGVAMARQ